MLGWFPPELIATYLLVKHDEIRCTADLAPDELRALYARLY